MNIYVINLTNNGLDLRVIPQTPDATIYISPPMMCDKHSLAQTYSDVRKEIRDMLEQGFNILDKAYVFVKPGPYSMAAMLMVYSVLHGLNTTPEILIETDKENVFVGTDHFLGEAMDAVSYYGEIQKAKAQGN